MRARAYRLMFHSSLVFAVACGGNVVSVQQGLDGGADSHVDASVGSPDVATDRTVRDGIADVSPRETSLEGAIEAGADAVEAGCSSAASCPMGEACDVSTGACTKKCSDKQLCNGGCCNGHACVAGTEGSYCGSTGSYCADCTEMSACVRLADGGGACGCAQTMDCPPQYACDVSTHLCTVACSPTQPCNFGCCNDGVCAMTPAPATCGPSGGACVDCTASPAGNECVGTTCGCSGASACPAGEACNLDTATCSTSCSSGAAEWCNGGCCSAATDGTCLTGTASTACGSNGSVCTDCTVGCPTNDTCACSVSGKCTTTATFRFTGSDQSFTVPTGVTKVTIVAMGAGDGNPVASDQSEGGVTTATISVTPGEVLDVRVGGNNMIPPFNGGGVNGDETAGDASDVRQGGTALANRVVVAGGGGSLGGGSSTLQIGGPGGGLVGGSGMSPALCSGVGGTGGTQSAGGAAGSGPNGSGQPGVLGAGGNAALSTTAGAGGGGYYGGGGGGSCSTEDSGSGGGGSSYVIPTATGVTMTQGGNKGTGLVTITW